MNVIAKYASLVKFSHTVFALPFALAAYFYAIQADRYGFDWHVLLWVLICMVAARNAAMGFNRWADRDIDADNPRTAGREIPAGKISPFAAMVFVVINCLVFVAGAWLLNNLALALSPVALIIILGYSYAKRFTWLSHFLLGIALAIAPAGAYIAVTGTLVFMPVILAFLVFSWVAGFDILYSLQDAAYDRGKGLHSVPSHFSIEQSLGMSMGVHLFTLGMVFLLGVWISAGVWYWIGAGLFGALLILQHILITPKHLERVGAIFSLVNGLASLVFAAFFIADLYFPAV